MQQIANPVNIKDAVLEKYHPILESSFKGELSLSNIPPHFLKHEFRQSSTDKSFESTSLPKIIEEKKVVPPRNVTEFKIRAPQSRPVETHKKELGLISKKLPTILDTLPLDNKNGGISFNTNDVVIVESQFAEELFVLEVYKNPAGNIQDHKFTAEDLTRTICGVLGQHYHTSLPTNSEFENIRLIEDLVGTVPGRINFRIVGKGEIMIMPNNTSPFFALRVPESVNCTLLFRQEEIDEISYEKIDIFLKKDAPLELVTAIKCSLKNLTGVNSNAA